MPCNALNCWLLRTTAVFLPLHGYISVDARTGKARSSCQRVQVDKTSGRVCCTPGEFWNTAGQLSVLRERTTLSRREIHSSRSPMCLSTGRLPFLLFGCTASNYRLHAFSLKVPCGLPKTREITSLERTDRNGNSAGCHSGAESPWR